MRLTEFTWLVLTATSYRASKSITETVLQHLETGREHCDYLCLDSPKQNQNTRHECFKVIMSVVFGVRVVFHIAKHLVRSWITANSKVIRRICLGKCPNIYCLYLHANNSVDEEQHGD